MNEFDYLLEEIPKRAKSCLISGQKDTWRGPIITVYAHGYNGDFSAFESYIEGNKRTGCEDCIHRLQHLIGQCGPADYCFGYQKPGEESPIDLEALRNLLCAEGYTLQQNHETGIMGTPKSTEEPIVFVTTFHPIN